MTVPVWFPRHEDLSACLCQNWFGRRQFLFSVGGKQNLISYACINTTYKNVPSVGRVTGVVYQQGCEYIFNFSDKLPSRTRAIKKLFYNCSDFLNIFIYIVIYMKLLIFLCSNRHSSHISNKWDCVTRCILWIAWRYYHRTVLSCKMKAKLFCSLVDCNTQETL